MENNAKLVQCNMTRDWVLADPRRLEQVTIMQKSAAQLAVLTTQIAKHNQGVKDSLEAICDEIGDYGRISSPDVYAAHARDTRTSAYIAYCELIYHLGQMETAYAKISGLACEDPYCWLLFSDFQVVAGTKTLLLELFITQVRDLEELVSLTGNLANRAWSPAHITAMTQLAEMYKKPADFMASVSADFETLARDYLAVITMPVKA